MYPVILVYWVLPVGRPFTPRHTKAIPLTPLRELGLQLVHELPGGAPAPPSVPAVPEERPLSQLFTRYLYPALLDEPGDHLQVPLLVGGGEGHAQAEAGGQRQLLLHGVAGVNVVADGAISTFFALGEAFADQVAAVGGSIEPDVPGRLLDTAFEESLERLVLYLVLLEGEVVHEENKARAAPAQGIKQVRQLLEVLLGELDEPEAEIRILVQDGLYGRGLAGARQPVQERVVGWKFGEEAFGVPNQGLALPLVTDQTLQAHRVGVRHNPEIAILPTESPIAS